MALRDEKAPGVLVIDDLGCGALINLESYGLPHEPTAPGSIKAGADLCCFSGDKLIGGPQAGIIVGREALIARIRTHPLTRMLRVGKLTDLALEHTLRLFLEPERLLETHPTLRMIALPVTETKKRAIRLKRRLDRLELPAVFSVIPGESSTGGGSLPATPIPTWLVAADAAALSPDALAAALRRHEPPVAARIQDGRVVLDMRTLLPGEERIVAEALAAACRGDRQ